MFNESNEFQIHGYFQIVVWNFVAKFLIEFRRRQTSVKDD